MCFLVKIEGPNFSVSQSTNSDGQAVSYVKQEKTLFRCGKNSLLLIIAPLKIERNDKNTQYFKPLWGIYNHETEKKIEC